MEQDNGFYAAVQQVVVWLLFSSMILYLIIAGWPRFSLESAEESLPPQMIPAVAADSGLFGNIRVSATDKLSLSHAYLLINGERVADFATADLLLRVAPGDVIQIDGSAYRAELSFEIERVSTSIDSAYLADEVICRGNVVQAGIIVFR